MSSLVYEKGRSFVVANFNSEVLAPLGNILITLCWPNLHFFVPFVGWQNSDNQREMGQGKFGNNEIDKIG